MTSTSKTLLVALILLAGSGVLGTTETRAQETNITYPVAELGNCANKTACYAYCDDMAHIGECATFAEAHGLMNAEEVRVARLIGDAGEGPGGCRSKKECEAYCENTANMRACIAFAKRSGSMPEEKIAEAEKMAAFLDSGGQTPGNCRGEKACRAYCEATEHMNECAEFAIKMGFMSEKEAEMFRKTGGKGPGNCVGRACEAYCKDEANREACITFAMEHDLMSAEDKQSMREGMEKAREALSKTPPAVRVCIERAVGNEALSRIEQGEGIAPPRLGEVLPQCFREVMGDASRTGPFGSNSAARDCMQQVFGEDFEEGMRSGTLDPGARDNEIRECMQRTMGDGFLNDQGQWERPENGEPPREKEWHGPSPESFGPRTESPEFTPRAGDGADQTDMRARYDAEHNATRAEMEMRMREEIETQMRSGTFDRSRLPSDFRPEGAFPPPESFERPPAETPPPSSPEPTSIDQPVSMLVSPPIASVFFAIVELLGRGH